MSVEFVVEVDPTPDFRLEVDPFRPVAVTRPSGVQVVYAVESGRPGQPGQDGSDGTDGQDGSDGTDGVDGVSIVWRGTYDQTGDTTYAANDAVHYQGSTYICTLDGTIGNPTDYPNRWDLMTAAGTDGSSLDVWDYTLTYQAGQVVIFGGNTWRSTGESTHVQPDWSSPDWTPVSNGLLTPVTDGSSIVGAQLPVSLTLNDWALYLRNYGDLNHSIRWGWGDYSIDGPVITGAGGVGVVVGDSNAHTEQVVAEFRPDGIWAPGDLVIGSDDGAVTVWGNAATASKLAAAVTINGVSFDGSDNITVTDESKVPATRTINGHTLSGDVTVTKSDIGLGSVDNTADSAKSVSYAATAGSATTASSATTAATATALASSRTFQTNLGSTGAVGFDGTANVSPGVTGTLPVGNGGTGRSTSTTAYGLIAAGTTATGAHQTLAAGATTEILVGGGASALPVWTTATGTGAPVRTNNPALIEPKVDYLKDTANRYTIQITASASSVNYIQFKATNTGVYPSINPLGSDADIGLQIITKGAGQLSIYVPTGQTPTVTGQGADSNHNLNLTSKGASDVLANGNVVASRVSVPSTASSTGRAGQFACDSSYKYECIATNTWVRHAVASW